MKNHEKRKNSLPDCPIWLIFGYVGPHNHQNKNLSQIFYFIGLIICFVGGIIGLSLGSLLVFIQKYSSIINVPGTNLSYPVEFNIKNIIVVFLTLIILGSISSLWSIRGIKKISNQAMN